MQFDRLKRRDFIALLGGVAASPVVAQTRSAMPVIGYLSLTSPDERPSLLTAFLQGLEQAGYSSGHNVAIEYRSAAGDYDRLPQLAAELVKIPVAVLAATGGEGPVRAAKTATKADIEAAFASLQSRGVDALLLTTNPFYEGLRDRIVALAARHAVPALYPWREYSVVGGLISYGTSFTESYRQAGLYVGRILNGEKSADLPVVQASKFELLVNLKTAKTLGLEVPTAILLQADEVIE